MRKTSFLKVFSTILVSAILFGCSSSGGGGNGGAEDIDSAQLSSSSAYPGEFITITDESIQAGEESAIEFISNSGYKVGFSVEAEKDGSVRVAVPTYFDPDTKDFAQGSVSVKINNRAASGTFLIKAAPDLKVEPGTVFVSMLRKNMAQFESARAFLVQVSQEEGIDFDDAIGKIDERLAIIDSMADQVETTETLTVRTTSGYVTLDSDDLRKLDKWLASLVLGMEAELLGGSPVSAEGINPFDNLGNTAEEMKARIENSIDNVIQEFKRGIDGGKVLIGGVTVAFAVAGAFVGGPAGAVVGAAAGLAMAYFAAGFELGSSAALQRISESFSNKIRYTFDYGQIMLDQLIRIGAAAAGGIEGAVGTVCGWISAAISSYDTVNAAEDARCKGQGGSFLLAVTHFSAISIRDFCGDNYVIPTDALTATISIGGAASYSRSFSPAHVLATFTSISDGSVDVMTGIPSIIGTDRPYTDESVWEGDILIIMLNPEEISGPFPREIEVTGDLWLVEGGLADLTFSTPSLRNDTPLNDPVVFKPTSEGGTIYLEAYGTEVGVLLKGTFSIGVEGDLDHWDYAEDDYGDSEYLTGTISGSFEGVLSEPPEVSE